MYAESIWVQTALNSSAEIYINMSTEERRLNLRVDLQGDSLRKFQALKTRYNFESNTDLIRYLIAQEYEAVFGEH